ncbi:MAG TPA: histidine kinase [Bryobacteraceae bacterium]|nr:histidine kinase [Bryobacteraceae bacterium]
MRRADIKLETPDWRGFLPQEADKFRASSAHLLATEEEERRRVSRELHDELGQRLALLEIQIEEMGRRLGSDPNVASGLNKLRAQVGEIADDVHRICYRLHPAVLEHLGLIAALRSYCQEFAAWSGVRTRFTEFGVFGAIPPGVALCIYRIVQEGLRNVAKHACASRALVMLRVEGSALQVVVKDFGQGFVVREGCTKGLGLTSLAERVRLAGGACVIRSAPGHGTRIQASVPLLQTPPSKAVLACAG